MNLATFRRHRRFLSALLVATVLASAPLIALAEGEAILAEAGQDVPVGHGDEIDGAHVATELPSMVNIAATLINFALFAGIIIVVAGPKLTAAMQARRQGVLDGIDEASRLRREAEAQVAAYQAKLDAFDQERAALLAEFREIGERERDRLISDATIEAARITSDAQALGEREERSAARGVETRLIDRAMDLAVADVQRQVNPMVQNRLIERSIDSFKSLKAN